MSPTTGSNAVAARCGVSGPSGAVSIDAAPARVCASSRSNPSESRGRSRSPAAPHVPARVDANDASSSSNSCARSRRRRGSARSASAVSGRRSVSRCSRSVSHGSHDSMPSNSWPSARRSHCSRPHGCCATSAAARARTSSVGSSSRVGKMHASATSWVERWSATENADRRSTSSPQRSMRTGWSSVDGYTSTIDPRTATSPRASTWYSRRYPAATRRSTSASRST